MLKGKSYLNFLVIYSLFIVSHIFQNYVKMANYKKFGQHIRYLRREKDLTQDDLAEITHLDIKSINAIEKGERNPTLKTITKIAKALKAHIDLYDFI